MVERPLILFADPKPADKAKRSGGAQNYYKPTHERQIERLYPQFNALQNALEKGRFFISQSSEGTEPEYTLVLEVAGDPRDFDVAVRHLDAETEGVEWLFELVDDNVPNDNDFYRIKKTGERDDTKTMSYKYFCILTNQRALSEILSLWNHFKDDPTYKFPTGKTGLRNVFQTLKDIHIWGTAERLEETGILDAWKEDLQDITVSYVKCEIELFYRRSATDRTNAQHKVESEIVSLDGQVIAKSCIDAIGYQAILASIPRQYAEKIINREEVALVALEQIMFFKPTGQSIVTGSEESFDFEKSIPEVENILDEPIVALFDGLPQERHPLLNNLLTVDDLDDYTSFYQIADRIHGTSMASLIARGDLLSNSPIITRKLYVRPIMKPYPTSRGTTQEFIPDDLLVVDKIHEAIRRLFEPEAGKVAPTVRIINLSIGIGNRLFYNMISPLAKLLDWLSFKYRVLFIVSSGNHAENIDLGIAFDDFKALPDSEKDAEIIRILDRNSRNLRLLSPAESMNSLTVGALFADESTYMPNPRQVIPCSSTLPSPISSLGRGINRSIKPDFLFPGGRSVIMQNMTAPNIAFWRSGMSNHPPGILSARPITVTSSGNSVGYSFGTSDAAALTSHNAVRCFEILNGIFWDELNISLPSAYAALLIKAMLTHGAKWDAAADVIRHALGLSGRAADQVHKWIGYGIPDITRVEECTRNRVTLIGYGELQKDSAYLYNLPLPFDFHTRKMFRALTVTLASFIPIKPTTQKYRAAQVWFTIDNGGKKLVPHRADADDKAVTRGALQHERFYGDSAVVWDESDSLNIKVNCREDAGDFIETVPYAIFATFEIAPEYNIDVYQRVVEKVRPKETITPT